MPTAQLLTGENVVSLAIVAFVYGVFDVQLRALRMQTEFRDIVLGVWPDKILKNKHMIIYFENDWRKLWILSLVSDICFGIVSLAIFFIYRNSAEVRAASACAAALMFTAFGGMFYSGDRDRRLMQQTIARLKDRPEEVEEARAPREASKPVNAPISG
jgi:hypothetical protein